MGIKLKAIESKIDQAQKQLEEAKKELAEYKKTKKLVQSCKGRQDAGEEIL